MILERFLLEGETAIVTGAGRGIGKAIANCLAEAGANVVVVGHSLDEIQATTKHIETLGRDALALHSESSAPADIAKIVDRAIAHFRRIHVLVNTSETNVHYTRTDRVTPEIWDEIVAAELRTVFFYCQAAGKTMIEHRRGSIVNVASTMGFNDTTRFAASAVRKAGILELTHSLATEWAPFHVRVNAIAPGHVNTDLPKAVREDPVTLRHMVERCPMGRAAEPNEIATAALFLASEAASYITGVVLRIDGGAII